MPKKYPTTLEKRDEDLRDFYAAAKKKNPQWRYDALLQMVAKQFYMSPTHAQRIILKKT